MSNRRAPAAQPAIVRAEDLAAAGLIAPDAVAAFIERARPQLLLVALGTPRSERFIDRWRPDAVCLGVGGTFDVLAGAVPRAPTWTHAVGLEGAYRVAMEPRKRWRVAWSGARVVFDALAHPGP